MPLQEINEDTNNVCMYVQTLLEVSKQQVFYWNPIVQVHIVTELELTLRIYVRDIVIIRDMSGGGWEELKGWVCSIESVCVCMCFCVIYL